MDFFNLCASPGVARYALIYEFDMADVPNDLLERSQKVSPADGKLAADLWKYAIHMPAAANLNSAHLGCI